jgi:hypothetical protein
LAVRDDCYLHYREVCGDGKMAKEVRLMVRLAIYFLSHLAGWERGERGGWDFRADSEISLDDAQLLNCRFLNYLNCLACLRPRSFSEHERERR